MSEAPRLLDEIRDLYAYNRWANARIREAVFQLPADVYSEDLASSFASIRDTLVHILSAEWMWLRRWKGESPREALDPADFSDHASVRWRWEEIELERASVLDGLTEERLADVVHYTNTKGEEFGQPFHHLLRHVVNHSTYHRGQIASMMRQKGFVPPATDLVLYHRVLGEG